MVARLGSLKSGRRAGRAPGARRCFAGSWSLSFGRNLSYHGLEVDRTFLSQHRVGHLAMACLSPAARVLTLHVALTQCMARMGKT
jgi:hypothetical protein